jgi:hypothetical protein
MSTLAARTFSRMLTPRGLALVTALALVVGPAGPTARATDLVVTGQEAFVTQNLASSGVWGFVEDDATSAVAKIHGLPADYRLKLWARDDVRGAMFAELLAIAKKSAAQRTAQESAALARLQLVTQQARVAVAQKAVDLFNSWQANPCAFQAPAGFPPYVVAVGYCQGGFLANIGNLPSPPGADQFTAWASALYYGPLLGSAEAQRALADGVTTMVMLAGAAAAGLAAATAFAIGSQVYSVAQSLAVTIAPFALRSAAALSAFGGAAAATVVGTVIFAVVTIALESWKLHEDLQVPILLNQRLTDAQSTPDVVAMSQDSGQAWQLWAAFVGQTLPDYRDRILSTYPVEPHGVTDASWSVTQPDGSVRKTDSFQALLWSDPLDPFGSAHFERVYVHDGWFVRVPISGPRFYTTFLPILTDDGKTRVAHLVDDGRGMLVSNMSDASAVLDPGACTSTSDPSCTRATTIDVRAIPAAGGPSYAATAKLVPNRPPPAWFGPPAGTIPDGTPFTIRVTASDPDGDPLTYTWRLPNTTQSLSLDGSTLYTVVTGKDAPLVLGQQGTWQVPLVVSDSSGASVSLTRTVQVVNAPPQLAGVTVTPSTADLGAVVTLTGTASDPGDDPVDLTVDWGDGTTSIKHNGCPVDAAGCVNLDPLPDGSPFSFSHTYTAQPAGVVASGGFFSPHIVLTAQDNGGGSATAAPVVNLRESAAPVVTQQPADAVTFPLQVTFMSAAATGSPLPTLTWQHLPKGETTWQDVPDPQFPTIFVSCCDGDQFRAKFTNTAGTTYTRAALLTVRNFLIEGQPMTDPTLPADLTAGVGEDAVFTSAATITPVAGLEDRQTPTISWEKSSDGTTWTPIPGADTEVLTVPAVTADLNGMRYRAVWVNGIGGQASRPATLTVVPARDVLPVLTVPATDVVAEATSAAGAPVTFTATAVDNIPHSPAVTCLPASGSTFPLGRTTVGCTTTDAAGNVATGSFDVVVQDNAPPTLTVPVSPMVVPATSPGGGLATWSATAVDAVDGPRDVTCTPGLGELLPFGTSTVTCEAEDSRGNLVQRQFDAVVRDITAPVISGSLDISVISTAASGAAVDLPVTVHDDVDGNPTLTCSPPSGVFPVGDTPVSCTARDAAGNVSAPTTGVVRVRLPAAPAPAPSPTPSPSASPSHTPSPAPTAPMIIAFPSTITAGDRTSVIYLGDPGETLELLAKTAPASVFHVIGSVRLDSHGLARSSHAPQRNTQLMARAPDGLLSDPQPVDVRAVASLHVARVASRTLAISGSVLPARAGRLVSIYRDGILLVQTRTDFSGVYRLTRRMPPGGYDLSARTGDDAWNLGGTSRTLQVRVG